MYALHLNRRGATRKKLAFPLAVKEN